jgi:hypothetical protein
VCGYQISIFITFFSLRFLLSRREIRRCGFEWWILLTQQSLEKEQAPDESHHEHRPPNLSISYSDGKDNKDFLSVLASNPPPSCKV